MTLPETITDVMPSDNELRFGVIASVHPTTVNIEGALIPAGSLSSYTPIIGDNVAVLRQDSTWLILGRDTSPSTGQFPQGQAGTVDVTVAGVTSATQAVVFPVVFRAAPSVMTNIATGAGVTALWQSRAINITPTGFTVFIFAAAAANFTAPVQWQAEEMTQ